MTVNLSADDAVATSSSNVPRLPVTIVLRTCSVLATVARWVAGNVLDMIREDLEHGRLSRDPRDWER